MVSRAVVVVHIECKQNFLQLTFNSSLPDSYSIILGVTFSTQGCHFKKNN